MYFLVACDPEVDPTPSAAPIATDTAEARPLRPLNDTCLALDRPRGSAALAIEHVFPELDLAQPVQAVQAPGQSGRWYVVERAGRIVVFDEADLANASVFLDIDDQVDSTFFEAGLLGLAFHRDYADNGEYFVAYDTPSTDGTAITARWSRFTSPDRAWDGGKESEEVLLQVGKPFLNHDGGAILWGLDDTLYMTLGDGGSAGDPFDNAQDTYSLMGKVLRIDPDAGVPYGIPPDNPFADGVGGAPEVWAYGLRNPWRMSQDRLAGDIWLGDVGQATVEEVDRVEAGGNYGWDQKEGTTCYEEPEPCDGGPYIDPIAEYGRTEGRSVVGGFVYRGSAIPALQGSYLYADFYTGNLWVLGWDDAGKPVTSIQLAMGILPSSFAEDLDGELYVLDYQGRMFKIVDAGGSVGGEFPAKLSETGCFAGGFPAAGLVPYEVNTELWSDGADKRRWLALPNGTTMAIGEAGDLELPPGAVLAKEFSRAGTKLETRLFMRHWDGTWSGQTYRWDEDQRDATWVQAGARVLADDGSAWTYPSPGECMLCHNASAGHSLGVELRQLDLGTQLDDWVQMGLLRGEIHAFGALSAIAGNDDVEARARSYLHANCSFCHRPDGGTESTMDLRAEALDLGVCAVAPQFGDLGAAGAAIVTPGDPALSVLALRMRAAGANRMPPLASEVIDEEAVAVIEAWIAGGAGCP
jgi:uncharacterized repeat protein (TIGR03806 family)